MAEALLRHHVALLGASGTAVTVASAGLISTGHPASDGAIVVMAERGIDLSAHRSQRLDGSLVASADLVLGMTRQHVRETVVLDTTAWERTFTLKELVRRSAETQPGQSWLAAVGVNRTRTALLGEDPIDDVEDPIGLSVEFYRKTADEIDALIGALLARLVTKTRRDA